MSIMPASMHFSNIFRYIFMSVFFLNLKSIHISSKQYSFAE